MFYRIDPELLKLSETARAALRDATNAAAAAQRNPRPAIVPTEVGTLTLAYHVIDTITQQPYVEFTTRFDELRELTAAFAGTLDETPLTPEQFTVLNEIHANYARLLDA